MTTNGYVLITRDKVDSGIYVETVEDWLEVIEENERRRMLYCQAVADMEQVQEKVDQWLQDTSERENKHENINDQIAELISSIQWIANEHPLYCFHSYSGT